MSMDANAEIALANRILARAGVLDAFGHVSMRSADDPTRFLISRNRAPVLVSPEDILEIDLDGQVIRDGRSPYLERFIHSALYAARPDIQAIVHSHAPAMIPFTVSSLPLRPVMHVAGFLGMGVARFDTADFGDEAADMLVSSPALGADLARALGGAPIVLMRGHGYVTVADSLPLAVFQAVYAQVNASIQLQTASLGHVDFLSEVEAGATRTSNAGQVRRAWDAWTHQVQEISRGMT